MNCEDMINIPELKNVLNLKAGFDGIKIQYAGYILQIVFSA